MTRIGTCSLCGGSVVVPEYAIHPVPHCDRCGAIAKVPHGPVVEMERPVKAPLPTNVIFRGMA